MSERINIVWHGIAAEIHWRRDYNIIKSLGFHISHLELRQDGTPPCPSRQPATCRTSSIPKRSTRGAGRKPTYRRGWTPRAANRNGSRLRKTCGSRACFRYPVSQTA
ncbi:hypothetical protein ABIB57_004867 [Devosia sp. UYZn731]